MVDLRLRRDAREDDGDDENRTNGDDDSMSGPPTGFPTNFPFTSNMVMPIPSSVLSRFTAGDHSYSYPNGGDISRGSQTTLQTSQSSHTTSPSGQTDTRTLPSPTITDSGPHTTTAFAGTVGQNDSNDLGDKGHDNGGVKVAAGAVPGVLLVIVIIVAFLWMRRRKRQRQTIAHQGHTEMKATPGAFVAAHYGSNPPPPPPAAQPQVVMPPSQTPPPPPATLAPPQPVILGPIGSGSNGAYFTGIDTSDAMSTQNDRTGLGNPFADGDSLAEEPPPPYRPRSMATASRNSSMRVPPSVDSQTSLVANESQPVRSPFADPDEDDFVSLSDMSGPTFGRNHNEDALSVVSDLSYQQEPVTRRP